MEKLAQYFLKHYNGIEKAQLTEAEKEICNYAVKLDLAEWSGEFEEFKRVMTFVCPD